jgi:hypothetical protein
MVCASFVLSEIPVIAYRFSIASRGSVIVCTMLEPRLVDWLRETGGRFFSAGVGCGLIVLDPTIPFGDHGAPVWGFDGEFVVNCVVDVVA